MNEDMAVIREALRDELEESVELRYGGSVHKHTYVDGISDVDLLAVVKRDTALDTSPKQLIRDFANVLKDRLPRNAEVEAGDLAVTVRLRDGLEIQLLPAFRTRDGYRIARRNGETWSNVVRPKEFAAALTEVNQQNGGQVVPAIKLLKIAQESLPETARLGGYHIESIATETFRNYTGTYDRREVFLHLLRSAKERVLHPIEESTGQSTYVDRRLGPSGSDERLRVSRNLDRMLSQLESADRAGRQDEWKDRFS